MEVPLHTDFSSFFVYSMNDVFLLKDIVWGQLKLINWLITDVLKLPESFCFQKHTIPFTQGALVSRIFLMYLENLLELSDYQEGVPAWVFELPIEKRRALLRGVFAKVGLLRETSDVGVREERVKRHDDLFQSCTPEEFVERLEDPVLFDHVNNYNSLYEFTAFSQASIPYFVRHFSSTTGIYNGIVSGGRCVNERSWEFLRKVCAYIDLASCYGKSLVSFFFPLGLPHVLATTQQDHLMILGKFLAVYEKELVANQYKITVSGKLSFRQDLVFSKLTTQSRLRDSGSTDRKFSGVPNLSDVSHLDADFVLLRKEIRNGVLTSDILETLRAVCSSREFGEILSLKVVTACYWSKTDQCDSLWEWIEEILGSSGSFQYDGVMQSTSDSRSRAWYGVPLAFFIGSLVEERLRLKKQAKESPLRGTQVQINAKQNALKLVINVFYGVLASLYFRIGNSVLADTITGRARTEVWKVAKAFNTSQSITDGGVYSLLEVFHLKPGRKKPSMNALQNVGELEKHRAIGKGPLRGLDWLSIFQDPSRHGEFRHLDRLAQVHLDSFWASYGLKPKLSLEHKIEQTALKAATFSKAHYGLLVWDETSKSWSSRLFVIRGDTDSGKRPYPIRGILNSLLDERFVYTASLDYEYTSLLRLHLWSFLQTSAGVSEELREKRPGEEMVQTRHFRLNNRHMPIDTVKEYERRVGRARRNSL